MYAKNYFKPEAKEAMLEMTNYLRDSFKELLDENDWMDDVTKEKARKKLDTMKQYLAYQDEFLDRDLIDGLYEGVEIKDDDLLGNALRLNRHWTVEYYKKYREPIDPNDWKEHKAVALVNAFYHPTQNYFEFPAGILQGVFFNNGRPSYMNYGGIGMIIGHEMTHGFDDQGRQRDYTGMQCTPYLRIII